MKKLLEKLTAIIEDDERIQAQIRDTNKAITAALAKAEVLRRRANTNRRKMLTLKKQLQKYETTD